MQTWYALALEGIIDDIAVNQWAIVLQYLQGLTLIIQIHRNYSNQKHIVVWKRRLDSASITPQSYSRESFLSNNIVYVKLHPRIAHTYIGHSGHNMHQRDGMRIRKLRQRKNGKFVSTEMAVHFWHKFNNFFQYVSIVYSTHRTKQLAIIKRTTTQNTSNLHWRYLGFIHTSNWVPQTFYSTL